MSDRTAPELREAQTETASQLSDPRAEALREACRRSAAGRTCPVHGGYIWPAAAYRCNGWIQLALALPTEPATDERQHIEERARLQDAYDALRAAVLWLHGEYRDKPRSEFNAEAWYRKARSGNVGLRDVLAKKEQP